MDSRYPLYIPQGHWWPKKLKAKHNREDIKLFATEKTTYIEVNTLSTSNIQNFLLRTIVYQRVTSDPKIIWRTKNAKNIVPMPVTKQKIAQNAFIKTLW